MINSPLIVCLRMVIIHLLLPLRLNYSVPPVRVVPFTIPYRREFPVFKKNELDAYALLPKLVLLDRITG